LDVASAVSEFGEGARVSPSRVCMLLQSFQARLSRFLCLSSFILYLFQRSRLNKNEAFSNHITSCSQNRYLFLLLYADAYDGGFRDQYVSLPSCWNHVRARAAKTVRCFFHNNLRITNRFQHTSAKLSDRRPRR